MAESEERLFSAARLIRLDLLAVTISHILSLADIQHVVIKGVTTSRWLYSPPREYRDVDILIPPSALKACVAALVDSGVAVATDARVGEEASHSFQLVSKAGAEIDVHVTLPTLDVESGEAVWAVMAEQRIAFQLDVGKFPALTFSARCLVIAMHVIASGHESEQVREDLRRAISAAGPDRWQETLALASTLGLGDDVAAALAFVRGEACPTASKATRLRLTGASATAIQLEKFQRSRMKSRIRMIREELFPSRAFMLRYDPSSAGSSIAMIRSRVRRLRRIAGMMMDDSV